VSGNAALPILRPRGPWFKAWINDHLLIAVGILLNILRETVPILRIGKTCFVTRYDDVREVLAADAWFQVRYQNTLGVVTDGQPFILSMTEGSHADIDALRTVILSEDLRSLARTVEAEAEGIVTRANGRLDCVDGLSRQLSFSFLTSYLGLTAIPAAELRAWSTRLFEYVFFGGGPALANEAAAMAPLLRAAIDAEILRARAATPDDDTVLTRCLRRQAQGDARFTDEWIRTNLTGLIVGGPPQPPVVVPHMLDQLLRRPDALASACAAARADDDDLLYGHLLEALRFHPLAPAILRIAPRDTVLAIGSGRDARIPAGTKLFVGIGSAMQDSRRLPDPARFDPHRPRDVYLHFGHGVHQCFGRYINQATLPMMLKPLLKRPGLRRAAGKAGRMSVNGPFPSALWVAFDD
jgi:cytochrome P450